MPVFEGFEVLADGFGLCAFAGRELHGERHEGALFEFEGAAVGVRVFGYEDVWVEGVPVAPVV